MSELIAYASRTGTKRNLDGLRAMGWRLLISAAGVQRDEGFKEFAIDNGAWSARDTGEYPDPLKRRFIRLVIAMGALADWAVPPDIVAAGGPSLALSLRWTGSRRRADRAGRCRRRTPRENSAGGTGGYEREL